MAYIIKQASLFLFSKKCADKYFDEFDFLDVGCFKASLSKGLGVAIILGSLLVKVPQILKIIRSKSVKGINVCSVMLDLFAITVMSSYSYVSGFPFSAWGDAVFLGLQTLAIALLVLYDNRNTIKASAFFIAYSSIIAAVVTGLTPKNVLWTCQTMNIPVILTGRLIQAYTNYSNGSTGQLSAITCCMLFFGSLARIFTSIQETGDKTMILMYICSTSANAVILCQLLYYWNADTKASKDSKKQK